MSEPISTTTMQLVRPPIVSWDPQPDITAYEVAWCVPIIGSCTGLNWTADDVIANCVDKCGEAVRRHFKVEEQR